MPNYRIHIAGGSLFWALIYYFLLLIPNIGFMSVFSKIHNIHNHATLIGIVIFFSLWPDVDTRSVGRGLFYSISFAINLILICIGYYKISAILGLFAMLPLLTKHRGWTHSKKACIILPSLFLFSPMLLEKTYTLKGLPYYIAAVTGYSSHLILDKIWNKVKYIV